MRSGMLILPQAREALALRGGDQRRAGVHPYGGSGRGVVSTGRAVPCLTPLWCGTAGAEGV